MMWMLMMLIQSPVIPDGLKPVQTYYQTQTECEAAYLEQMKQGHYNGFCVEVTWN